MEKDVLEIQITIYHFICSSFMWILIGCQLDKIGLKVIPMI